MEVKQCSKCKQTLPLSEFYRDNGQRDGLYRWCKACTKAHNSRYQHEHKAEISGHKKRRYATDSEARERCIQAACRWQEEHKRVGPPKKRGRKPKQLTPEEQAVKEEARKQYARDYIKRKYAEDPSYWREYTKGHREQIAATVSAWKAAHPDYEKTYRQEHREEHNARERQWRKDHPEEWRAKHRRMKARRRALKKGNAYTLTDADIIAIKAKGCFFCGTHEDLTIAHDIAVVKRGDTTRGNCFCLCRSCNSRMGTKGLPEIIRQLSFIE